MASAAPEIRTVSGATPASLDATINAFKADVGDRRSEIDWDGVPASATPLSFRVPASAKKGKQKLRFELGGAVTRSVTVTVI